MRVVSIVPVAQAASTRTKNVGVNAAAGLKIERVTCSGAAVVAGDAGR
jgi:hypothetical protein